MYSSAWKYQNVTLLHYTVWHASLRIKDQREILFDPLLPLLYTPSAVLVKNQERVGEAI